MHSFEGEPIPGDPRQERTETPQNEAAPKNGKSGIEPEQRETREPTDVEVTNAFENLGAMQDELPQGADPKLELAIALWQNDESYWPKARATLQENIRQRDQAGRLKTSTIHYLRALIRGHDWRSQETVERLYDFLNERLTAAAGRLQQLLSARSSAPEQTKKIEAEKTLLARYSRLRANLEQIAEAGYPELWETIKAPEKPDQEEGAEAIREDVLAHGAVGLDEAGKEKPESEAEREERERQARLGQAIEKKLPTNFRRFAPEIVSSLVNNGFNFVERPVLAAQNGKPFQATRFILFLDPRTEAAQTQFPRSAAGTFEQAPRNFAQELKKSLNNDEIPTTIRIALNRLLTSSGWNYASQEDAEAVLKFLNSQEQKPFAMYISKGAYTNSNLAAIDASSGQFHLIVQHTDQAPEYKDGTVFSAAPVFTFDIRKEDIETK